MELTIKTNTKEKKINIEKQILSIEYSDTSWLDNLTKDYDCCIIDNTCDYFVSSDVLSEINIFTKYPELSLVSSIIKILDLDSTFFDKKIINLSRTEKYYLNLLRNLASLKDIIIFKDILLGLDNNQKKKLLKVIDYLKNNNFTVIICSSDVNVLYELADYSVLCTSSSIKAGTSDEIYTDVKTLKKLKLEVPTLSYITYKAKEEKNVKLFYSKDVRDIIKDIYKHV